MPLKLNPTTCCLDMVMGPGSGTATVEFAVDDNTAPGTNPVVPTVGGQVTVSGAAVAAHSIPVETHSRAANAFNIEVQVASAVTGAPGNTDAAGLAQFNDSHFTVDGDGYVSLVGGEAAIDSVTGDDTEEVTGDANGNINFIGEIVNNSLNPKPLYFNGIPGSFSQCAELQVAAAVTGAPADTNDAGIASFDDTSFSVDANGYVTLVGGGPAIMTLTPDTGGAISPTLGNINVFGELANSTQIIETHNVASELKIENRSWYTPYVVDTVTTVGERATFSTVQAAIDQAVTDGMTHTNPKVIYVRVGTYTENLTIYGGTILVGEVFTFPTGGVLSPQVTTISGNHDFSGTVVAGFNNITFINQDASANTFEGGDVVLAFWDNCYIATTGTGFHLEMLTASSSCKFTNCSFANTGNQVMFDFQNSASYSSFNNCKFEQPAAFNADNLNLEFIQCRNISEVTLNGADTTILATDSSFFSNAATACISGSASTANKLINCSFDGMSGHAIESTGNFFISGCTSSSTSINSLYSSDPIVTNGSDIQGNVIISTQTATDFDIENYHYYLGVTSTAAPRTIRLPDGTNSTPATDQTFIIKDESGGAGTNNITITTNGGTWTIDGSTSYSLDKDYGSIAVKYDGSTGYFIIEEHPGDEALLTLTGDTGGALSPTGGNLNILGGPGVTTSGSGSTLTINSVVFTDQGGSTSVTSDSGSFATAAIALTTPASPSQGDELIFVATSANALTVTAAGTQLIRIGAFVSSAGGTATSTAIGDAITLRYRTSDTTWYCVSAPQGTWLLA